ncbi:cytochrome b N-terminal domain-containing protein [Nonomuraea sp. NPDC000554]|uniref:cytochrome b N-terminal domain-containing protein n=1 Tax=Nonomuraea sp. NPDC000554 TaxID=3154259 RepID=UPI00332B1597
MKGLHARLAHVVGARPRSRADHWSFVFGEMAVYSLVVLFFTGAFRRPHGLNWLIWVGLFVLGIVAGVTGGILPDDLLSGGSLALIQGVIQAISDQPHLAVRPEPAGRNGRGRGARLVHGASWTEPSASCPAGNPSSPATRSPCRSSSLLLSCRAASSPSWPPTPSSNAGSPAIAGSIVPWIGPVRPLSAPAWAPPA